MDKNIYKSYSALFDWVEPYSRIVELTENCTRGVIYMDLRGIFVANSDMFLLMNYELHRKISCSRPIKQDLWFIIQYYFVHRSDYY